MYVMYMIPHISNRILDFLRITLVFVLFAQISSGSGPHFRTQLSRWVW